MGETGLKVLVVEDDGVIAMGVMMMLEELGHEPIEANSGAEAVDLVRSGTPIDVVLSDQKMPGMTGIELMAEIRRLTPGMPFVLATGFSELGPEGREAGLQVLEKPFGRDQLTDALSRATAMVRPA